MKADKTYIKITDEDDHSPSDMELMLDNYEDEEYNTPYTSYGEELPDFGASIEALGIFDGR